MNRMQELAQLQMELTPPDTLDATVRRGLRRAQRRRTGRHALLCACAPLAVLAVFTALVNLFPSFALACGTVPGLRELAKAVDFSPSLKAAVDNGYVQTIGQEQTQNGVTMRLEYVIADKEQWIVFYTLQQRNSKQDLDMLPHLQPIDGEKTDGFALRSSSSDGSANDLLQFSVFFVHQDAPKSVQLRCDVYAIPEQTEGEAASSPLASFVFPVNINPEMEGKPETVPVNRTFLLDGQTLTLKEAVVYPTHMTLNFTDDSANTAWLKDLKLSVQDDQGRNYSNQLFGIQASGKIDSPTMGSYYVESPFFTDSKTLTLNITGATWLDKDKDRATIDILHQTAKGLPDGVQLTSVTRDGKNIILEFSGTQSAENCNAIFGYRYWDENGVPKDFTTSTVSQDLSKDGQLLIFTERVQLADCTNDTISLELNATRNTTLPAPISIPIR